jgi:phage terminase large subunit-like protein
VAATAPIRTKSDEAAVADGCYFDEAAAEHVRDFCRRFIRIPGTSGQPLDLLEWQWEGVVKPLFGWRRRDGLRRFDRAYLSTPKKNGKSYLLSGIGLYMLMADGEPSSEVYIAAGSRDQAGIIFREAAKMVKASPALNALLFVRDSAKSIAAAGGSFMHALSAEVGTKEGLNAHTVLFDELHAQPGRELWDCLRYAGAARRQPLLVSITTAGGDLQTICGEQYLYAKGVLGGQIIDPSFFAYVREADSSDPWDSEDTWRKANPSYGITLRPEVFKADCAEAKESPAKENSFRRYRLNQWVQTADAWLSMDQWDACADPVDANNLTGRVCYAGLDLSATDDTTALVLLFQEEDESLSVLPYFWLPRDNIDALERKHKVSYRAWAKAGLFNLTAGNVVDYREIRAKIAELAKIFEIKEISIDRKFQGQGLESDLIDDGFPVVPAGQGWVSQDLPAKELEKLLKAGRIRHGGHPVLRWHASNVVVDIDKNDNYSINKKKSRSKIDGIAALLMALMVKMRAKEDGALYVNSNPKLLVV